MLRFALSPDDLMRGKHPGDTHTRHRRHQSASLPQPTRTRAHSTPASEDAPRMHACMSTWSHHPFLQGRARTRMRCDPLRVENARARLGPGASGSAGGSWLCSGRGVDDAAEPGEDPLFSAAHALPLTDTCPAGLLTVPESRLRPAAHHTMHPRPHPRPRPRPRCASAGMCRPTATPQCILRPRWRGRASAVRDSPQGQPIPTVASCSEPLRSVTLPLATGWLRQARAHTDPVLGDKDGADRLSAGRTPLPPSVPSTAPTFCHSVPAPTHSGDLHISRMPEDKPPKQQGPVVPSL